MNKKPDCAGCCTGAGNEIPDLHHIYPCAFAGIDRVDRKTMTILDWVKAIATCLAVVLLVALVWTAIIIALIWIF